MDGPITDEMEARALLYEYQYVSVYSASWGPHDDGATMERPKPACMDALRTGVTKVSNRAFNISALFIHFLFPPSKNRGYIE